MGELIITIFYLAIMIMVGIIIVIIGGTAVLCVVMCACVVGSVFAMINYAKAAYSEMNFVTWTWERDDEPAKRSYFFGPGYVQLFKTIRRAFDNNVDSVMRIRETENEYDFGLSTWETIVTVGIHIFRWTEIISILVFGMLFSLALGGVHALITAIFMAAIYVVFSIVWICDRVYLLIHGIKADCPICKRRSIVPGFVCPSCGTLHKKLVPGPYGIFKHKCSCGAELPATFFNGRSDLQACCKFCNHLLVASDTKPIVFQLIGGTRVGKTVFLSAFYHKFCEVLNKKEKVDLKIPEQYVPYFNELEEYYSGKECPPTTQKNSQIYSLILKTNLPVKRQFAVYDIAGEMFDGVSAENEIQQQQFQYCNGFILLVDPFCVGSSLRMKKLEKGEDLSDFTDISLETVVNSFINYLVHTGHTKVNVRCDTPVSVVIGKSDMEEVYKNLSPDNIQKHMEKNREFYNGFEQARDSVCRSFLLDIGFNNVINNLETQFTNIHYFPVSAMGHIKNNEKYNPWGILEPVEWMFALADKEIAALSDILFKNHNLG